MNVNHSIVIGGSAGSIPVVRKILKALPGNYALPIIVCLHRMKNYPEGIRDVLSASSKLKVVEPNDKDPIEPAVVFVAPANYHLLIENDLSFGLSTSEPINYSRPSIDLTFSSAASTFGKGLTAILLTGANKDGVEGLIIVKNNGGITIVQEPKECVAPYMPFSAIESGSVDMVMSTREIITYLLKIQSKVFP